MVSNWKQTSSQENSASCLGLAFPNSMLLLAKRSHLVWGVVRSEKRKKDCPLSLLYCCCVEFVKCQYHPISASVKSYAVVYRLADLHHMLDRDPSPHTDIAQACSPAVCFLNGEFEWVPRLIPIGVIGRSRTAHHQAVCVLSGNRAGRFTSGRHKYL